MRRLSLLFLTSIPFIIQYTNAQTPDWSIIPTIGSSPTTLETLPLGCVCIDESRYVARFVVCRRIKQRTKRDQHRTTSSYHLHSDILFYLYSIV